ncbi:hypothetical protein TTHERM_000254589 (macronuclear) [Tetrahymena thermophila SB210]|uniref:Uncharacterized protein n=1 Tax=Tetrahymena thermophila (strain SB210) TaxID=312017 RepID=W7X8F0_TETTS|nr:hypothetical protein TTHERM_000254589 [Tetrahymena thermophila SB210]EWS73622.1 hypothetical protein TTHERM_000254589 [Tetrahymena thermophila SB210]|eukprot:XP_012653852.1 hypothetical protein TTHERM_000254589 [Tetrahymena thermophila SB210]
MISFFFFFKNIKYKLLKIQLIISGQKEQIKYLNLQICFHKKVSTQDLQIHIQAAISYNSKSNLYIIHSKTNCQWCEVYKCNLKTLDKKSFQQKQMVGTQQRWDSLSYFQSQTLIRASVPYNLHYTFLGFVTSNRILVYIIIKEQCNQYIFLGFLSKIAYRYFNLLYVTQG